MSHLVGLVEDANTNSTKKNPQMKYFFAWHRHGGYVWGRGQYNIIHYQCDDVQLESFRVGISLSTCWYGRANNPFGKPSLFELHVLHTWELCILSIGSECMCTILLDPPSIPIYLPPKMLSAPLGITVEARPHPTQHSGCCNYGCGCIIAVLYPWYYTTLPNHTLYNSIIKSPPHSPKEFFFYSCSCSCP